MKLYPNSLHTWLSSVITFLRDIPKQGELGMLWLGTQARQARSLEGPGEKVRVAFRNECDETLILCWVDCHGNPHHFYSLQPRIVTSDEDIVTHEDHIETTQTGHAFLVLAASDVPRVQKTKSLEGTTFMGAYQPSSTVTKIITRSNKRLKTSTSEYVHLVSIHKRQLKEHVKCLSFCTESNFLRKRHTDERIGDNDVGFELMNEETGAAWSITVRQGFVDSQPMDSTCKRYFKLKMHDDMAVYAEENWHGGDYELEKIFCEDLHKALQCFPEKARERLTQGTAFWLNCNMKYGPAACPIEGRGMCFHPESDWLVQNGCHKEKTHGIELYKSEEYLRLRNHWGPGGVLVHELSHAYHCLCIRDGYENKDVLACYQKAIDEGIYESVAVHGSQGPKAKAYACTNAMEYFAELSTAFLGGTDECVEFNKWYPFNRKQVREHDPRAFELLQKLWHVSA
ncbi:hypothetical protein FisN_1Lh625 [Fistulifera solaris]|uniref:Uncharacterized protein n=1 Tax=Fistulifera solaris TaxID=1519565 RepID=A0A1Z5K0Y4_FISSO|nr:hypothetical protein FisN_1Lh625 [Fistulifera solaris]|eukprot:GAX19907.1 hypothetical protein FisN_1Lh625 [Fistulifera solaris]